jgi:membrane-bound ClpP family serine protease
MTRVRLILAIISTVLEELLIYAAWRWLLPEFGIEQHVPVLIGAMAAWAAFSTWLFIFTTRVNRKPVLAGMHTMVGTKGRAATLLNPKGVVKINGELWGATSEEGTLRKGEEVEVTGENGLKLVVRKARTIEAKR